MALDILKLFLVSLLPVGCAVILMVLLRYTKFKDIKKIYQTIIISIVFSGTCILGTVLSVRTSTGAAINVRDASPIIAGLIFGGPAGIIAGLVGGLYRFIAAFWDASLKTTQIACAIATACAGLFTAFIRKFIFNNHHGKWYYGIFIAILVETFHMLMIFITNFNDTQLAYTIVHQIYLPMLIGNALAVCISSISACLLCHEKLFSRIQKHKLKLTTKIQLSLVGLLAVVCAIVTILGYFSVYDNANKTISSNFETAVSDLKGSVDGEVNKYMEDKVTLVADQVDIIIKTKETSEPSLDVNSVLKDIEKYYKLSEINVVGKDNYVKYSTQGHDNPPFNMGDPSKAQAYEFTCLNNGTTMYVQDIREASSFEQGRTKYAGRVLSANNSGLGYVQIGLYEQPYHNLLDSQIQGCAAHRHIEQEGFLAVTDDKGNVVSISQGKYYSALTKIELSKLPTTTYGHYTISLDGETHRYYTYDVQSEGYHIIAFGDVDEILLPTRISITTIALSEVFAFMTLYFVLYVIIRRVVTNRIENIETGLQKISNGDLNVKIDERNSFEMNALSDNINKTVDSLKEYARKEAEKNAEELRFAKTIQHSVLPTDFPLNDKFEIYASMDTAKEVGGDFYDFFFVDPEHVVISIADVSGKGVPAALFMMQAKTTIKNLVETGIPLNEAFTEANHRLSETNDAEMFVTAWTGIVDLRNGHVEFVNAGHNPPIICNDKGEYQYLKSRSGFVLGGYDNFKYELQTFDIKPGHKIYLYTDGVTEAMNKNSELYGEERLLKVINENSTRGAHTLCSFVKEDVAKHVNGEEQSDDITMLCFRLICNESTDAIVVDAKIENVTSITDYVNKLLEEHGATPKAIMDIDIAIDELFSNICYYAYKPEQKGKAKIVVDFYEENKVAIGFEDRGIPYNPLAKSDPDASASLEERKIGGLGIFIVKKTMDDMEYKNVNGHNVLKIKKTIK